jgi:hypothetical protein
MPFFYGKIAFYYATNIAIIFDRAKSPRTLASFAPTLHR